MRTATRTVTQADLDCGTVLKSTATVTTHTSDARRENGGSVIPDQGGSAQPFWVGAVGALLVLTTRAFLVTRHRNDGKCSAPTSPGGTLRFLDVRDRPWVHPVWQRAGPTVISLDHVVNSPLHPRLWTSYMPSQCPSQQARSIDDLSHNWPRFTGRTKQEAFQDLLLGPPTGHHPLSVPDRPPLLAPGGRK